MVDYGIANGDTSMCGRAAPFLANMCALIGDICAPFPRNSHLSTAKLAPFSLNCARTAEIRTRNFAVARAGLAPSRCRLQSPCAKSSRVRPHSARGLTPRTSAPGLGSPRPQLHRDLLCPSERCAAAGEFKMVGVVRPTTADIYVPILDEMERDFGVVFHEKTTPL